MPQYAFLKIGLKDYHHPLPSYHKKNLVSTTSAEEGLTLYYFAVPVHSSILLKPFPAYMWLGGGACTMKLSYLIKSQFILLLFTLMIATKIEDHLVDVAPIIRQVPTTHKVVALTFDDGPLTESTPEILSILREKNIKATFFVVGEQVEKFPMLVQQEIADGHEVGSHSYSHPTLTTLNKNELEKELARTEQSILKVAPKPTLFRPPGGFYNDTILKMARDDGYITILWSVDPYDWRYPPVGDIVNVVLKDSKPGSIILLHDGKYPSSTPEALGFIIDSLSTRGYEFVTVSELLQYYEPKP